MKPTVLITGASRGIGKAIAIRFAQEGYSLVINCRKSADALADLKKELENTYHVSVLTSVGNIGDFEYVKNLFEEAKSAFGGIDIVINNAGISHIGLLSDNKYKSFFCILYVKICYSLYAVKTAG